MGTAWGGRGRPLEAGVEAGRPGGTLALPLVSRVTWASYVNQALTAPRLRLLINNKTQTTLCKLLSDQRILGAPYTLTIPLLSPHLCWERPHARTAQPGRLHPDRFSVLFGHQAPRRMR